MSHKNIDRYFLEKYFSGKKQTIFIFGCQRSGTTALCRLFGKSPFITEFNENYKPIFDQECYIKSHNILKNEINRVPSPYVVIKPIMHNHEINDFYFRYNPKIFIWLYRNYNDVVNSIINGGSHLQNCIKLQLPIHLKILSRTNEDFKNISFKDFDAFSPNYFLLYWLIENGILLMNYKKIQNLYVVSYDDLVKNEKIINTLFQKIYLPITKGILGFYKKSNSDKISFKYDKKLIELADIVTTNLIKISENIKKN